MEAHVMKLENNCVIVDEEYFNEIKKQSEFNQERINEIAEERFLEYVKESGIELSYKVNGIPYMFHYDLLNEINYEERGYPESVYGLEATAKIWKCFALIFFIMTIVSVIALFLL